MQKVEIFINGLDFGMSAMARQRRKLPALTRQDAGDIMKNGHAAASGEDAVKA